LLYDMLVFVLLMLVERGWAAWAWLGL